MVNAPHHITSRNTAWEHLHELRLHVPSGGTYNTAPRYPLSMGGSMDNICWEYHRIWGWSGPSRTQLEITDRMTCSHQQTTLLSRKQQQHQRENELKQVREELGSARIAFLSQMDRLRQRKTNREAKRLPIAWIIQALWGGGGWVQAHSQPGSCVSV